MSCRVTFMPERRSWRGDEPVPLALAAATCDILLEQPCGARAACGRCRVRVHEGAAAPSAADAHALDAAALTAGWRLGCRVLVDRTLTVEVPFHSRAVAHKSFGGDELFTAGFEPVATDGWGVALDVGSTTLAAALVSLTDGSVHGTASALNPQVACGGDVMSRIAFARRHPGGDRELHRVLVDALDTLIERAAGAAGVDVADVAEVCAVGNPTMLHALRALPLAPLGTAPFQGSWYGAWEGEARAVGLALPAARALLLPGIRAHVGADTVAAILAAGLDRVTAPVLLLDLGTNSEVVLATPDRILCTSAAAGPAFEGASIRCGMRAVSGAIEQVRVSPEGRLLVRTIEDAPAAGICGSGLLDAVAELLRAGVLEPSGRVRAADEPALAAHPELAARITAAADGRIVRLDERGAVVLTAQDVRELQLVKAGIAAAVELLLAEARLRPAELSAVLLAGAFGSYLRLGSALELGLLPPVPPERIHFVGNAAGAGARLALVDRRARERAVTVARAAQFVELAGRSDYQEAFVAMLPFPEPT